MIIGGNCEANCCRCGKRVDVDGAQFCDACWYPGINEDWRRYRDLVAEGYTRFQAKIMAGLADPPGDRE